MTAPPSRLALASLALACLFALPARADETRDETERWVPSLGLEPGLLFQNADAEARSGPITYQLTTRTRSTTFPFVEVVTLSTVTSPSLRPSASGDDQLLTPTVTGNLELMSPGIQIAPGRPRFFARGDAGGAFGNLRHIARERSPKDLQDPLPTIPNFSEDAVEGVGSETTAEVQPLLVRAGAGVAFTLDLWGRRFRIKPSVEYLREEIELSGAVHRAVQTDTGINLNPPNIPLRPSRFFGVVVEGSTTEEFHGLGPGLELEMDTRRAGPFLLSLYVGAQAYKILSDTEVDFSKRISITDTTLVPNPQTVGADWSFEKDPWIYRGGVGLRFRWLPE